MTPDAMKSLVQKVSDDNFNVIYVTIDDYLDIHNLPESDAKNAKIKQYNDSLEQFITYASTANISVDSVVGSKEWAKPTYRWKPIALLKFAQSYNVAHPSHKLRSFQFDVEPYLLPEYEGSKAPVLLDFVTFVDEMVSLSATSDLRLSFVIPHFYDKGQQWTPPITFKNLNAYTFTHMLNSLSRLPDSTILIMAYRNFAEGDNGVIMLSQPEITEATAMAKGGTKIIVAQETGNVTPSYVTYFGTSLSLLLAEISKIDNKFKSFWGYGGIGIHYSDPYWALSR
jgi:hypothetical protein